MRLPLTVPLDTRDGVSAKNARLTNCLKEVKKAGEKAVVRPGLVLDAQAAGIGNGLVNSAVEVNSIRVWRVVRSSCSEVVNACSVATRLPVETVRTVRSGQFI